MYVTCIHVAYIWIYTDKESTDWWSNQDESNQDELIKNQLCSAFWKIIKITHTHIHTNWFIVNKSTLRQIIKLYSLIYCMRSMDEISVLAVFRLWTAMAVRYIPVAHMAGNESQLMFICNVSKIEDVTFLFTWKRIVMSWKTFCADGCFYELWRV